jgi:uncharacterized protein with von Willebrand factor type A (vWA) domain
LEKRFFKKIQQKELSSLILILDRSGSMHSERTEIAKELSLRVASAYFEALKRNKKPGSVVVIIFDD